MSIGEKIKKCRKEAGLSQEQLAEKLCVSRQAVAKWEADRGMPDVENLKSLSALFDTSVDYLLDDGSDFEGTAIKEAIDLSIYKKGGACRSRQDAAVKARYPEAENMYALLRKRKLTPAENVVDFIVQPGVLHIADSLQDNSSWYLVEQQGRQFMVKVTKEFMESRPLASAFAGKKKIVGNNIFKKFYRI